MKKTVLILLLLAIGISGLLLSMNTTQGQQAEQQDLDDVPTVVTRGKFTEKEKEYSKEYKKLYPDRTEKLGEAVKYAKERKAPEVGISLGIPTFPTVSIPPTATQVLRKLSCQADAVVLGSVESKASHLTEDETWVYTEYDFLVDEVVKDNLASPIESNNKIQITRPGGLIKLDYQVVRVQDRLYEQLKKNKKYLLFLKFVPSTQGYLVSNAKGDFVLQDNHLKSLSHAGIPSDLRSINEYQVVLNNIRSFAFKDCSQKLNGEALKLMIIKI